MNSHIFPEAKRIDRAHISSFIIIRDAVKTSNRQDCYALNPGSSFISNKNNPIDMIDFRKKQNQHIQKSVNLKDFANQLSNI
jgi:hypothetical protein